MQKESAFSRHARVLKKYASSDVTWESNAALKCELADENTDDPVVQVLRSPWGREHPGLAARLTAAIKWVGREDTLRVLLLSDLGRSNPERVCEMALEGSNLSAADVVGDDFDPRLMEP